MFFKFPFFALFTLLIVITLSGCVGDEPSKPPSPKIKAELVPNNGKNEGISFKEVLEIAANSSQMSCIELTLGSLQAGGLKAVSDSRIVEADERTRLLAGAVGGSADQAINKELQCHCDRGAPMPGYELFERRAYLQKNRRNRRINSKYMSFYPKDDSGQPRFLRPGEKIETSVLQSLPPAPPTQRFDDCGRQCKAARKRTNIKALAEGKPEPFPNLEYPRKKACVGGKPA